MSYHNPNDRNVPAQDGRHKPQPVETDEKTQEEADGDSNPSQ